MKELGFMLLMTTRTVAFHKYRITEVLGQGPTLIL